jgi:hypothetical protein
VAIFKFYSAILAIFNFKFGYFFIFLSGNPGFKLCHYTLENQFVSLTLNIKRGSALLIPLKFKTGLSVKHQTSNIKRGSALLIPFIDYFLDYNYNFVFQNGNKIGGNQ